MADREWYGRVLLTVLVMNIALAGIVALVAVARFELNGRFDFFYWLIFIVPAVVVGAFAALTSWSVTLGIAVALVRLVPTLRRDAVVAIALLIPGLLALLAVLPLVHGDDIARAAELPEVIASLALGSVVAVVAVRRTNRAAVHESPDAVRIES